MLRRLVGDEAFFSGIRRFYADSRFQKVGTEDLQAAMEAASQRSLDRFFERWIYGATLPRLTFSHRIEASAAGQQIVLRVDQDGDLFDVPVTVTIEYADRSVDVVVPVTERTVEVRVPVEGVLRGVEISQDDVTLADVEEPS
jgi:aminopeptidase N